MTSQSTVVPACPAQPSFPIFKSRLLTSAEWIILSMLAKGILGVDRQGRFWYLKFRRRLPGGRVIWGPPKTQRQKFGIRPETKRKGFWNVCVTGDDGLDYDASSHRVVWMWTRQQEITSAMRIAHKDGNKLNNAPDNLQMVPLALGRVYKRKLRMGDEHVQAMRRDYIGDDKVKGMGITACAKKYGISVTYAMKILKGTRRALVSGGKDVRRPYGSSPGFKRRAILSTDDIHQFIEKQKVEQAASPPMQRNEGRPGGSEAKLPAEPAAVGIP